MVANSDMENATGLAFDDAWSRAQRLLGIKTQRDLAKLLNINESNITQAKRRGFFPLEWAVYLAKNFNLSLDEFILGRETSKNSIPVDLINQKTLYIDPAVQLVDEAVKIAGVTINKKQKAAVLEIVREELQTMAVQMLRAMKRG